ncbi:hydroxymethylglutaryl-CoA lyase [Paraburkholderia tropica]|uniref:hydroxymethylglutaryl-CoA lyase n=1 Tax=Paraburkholderia tropica TaxID=92647 RepID=UPI0030199740
MFDVKVVEVGPRDGLQAISRIMPTQDKCDWIQATYDAGVRMMQVGSFVPARLLPQLADTPEIVRFSKSLPGLTVSVLVPNLKGAELAFATGVHHVSVPISVSEAHSHANVNGGRKVMIERLRQICDLRDTYPADERPQVMAGLSVAFGCTLQGEVPDSDVEQMAIAAIEAGADFVSLGDTTGFANPAQVRRLHRRVSNAVGARLNSMHFHDTRGLGLANVLAALDCGVRKFDASLGGLGGCPHAPGATGNIVTEDLVFMLESMGLSTGIDIDKLVSARAILCRALPDEPLHGHIWKAGRPGVVHAEVA